jgi:hypothetical protein
MRHHTIGICQEPVTDSAVLYDKAVGHGGQSICGALQPHRIVAIAPPLLLASRIPRDRDDAQGSDGLIARRTGRSGNLPQVTRRSRFSALAA